MAIEYRVVWAREGGIRKMKRYVSLRAAERFIAKLGPDPWEALGEDPDGRCCSGLECACGGRTNREQREERMVDMPKLLWTRLDQRAVGKWETAPERGGEVNGREGGEKRQ